MNNNQRARRQTGITTRSRRSLSRACRLAGVPYDPHAMDVDAFGVLFLELLVAGVDHVHVGRAGWLDAMMGGAPKERT